MKNLNDPLETVLQTNIRSKKLFFLQVLFDAERETVE